MPKNCFQKNRHKLKKNARKKRQWILLAHRIWIRLERQAGKCIILVYVPFLLNKLIIHRLGQRLQRQLQPFVFVSFFWQMDIASCLCNVTAASHTSECPCPCPCQKPLMVPTMYDNEGQELECGLWAIWSWSDVRLAPKVERLQCVSVYRETRDRHRRSKAFFDRNSILR